MEMEIGNCKQVWQTVNSPTCKRLHGADVETTSTSLTQDLLKISTALDNVIELNEQHEKFSTNFGKKMRAACNRLATLIQNIGNNSRQTEKSPNFSQNLAKTTTPILASEQQTTSDSLQEGGIATFRKTNNI